MALVTKTYTFSAGSVIVAAQHNTDFDTLYNLVNGSLTNANLAAAAAIVDTKLAQITTAGKVDIGALSITSQADNDSAYFNGTAWTRAALGNVSAIVFVIDGGGGVIGTGIAGDIEIPFGCAIISATALADQSGSAVVDIWKDTYANYPPTNADTITAAAPITLSTATKDQDTTLTGWTKAIAAGSTLRFNVDSSATITRLTIVLKVERN